MTSKLTDEIIQNWNQNSEIVNVYGAGKVAKISIINLLNTGIGVAGIFVKDVKKNVSCIMGIPVLSVEENRDLLKGKKLVIATFEKTHKEIEAQLDEIPESKLFFMTDQLFEAWEKEVYERPMRFETRHLLRYVDTNCRMAGRAYENLDADSKKKEKYVEQIRKELRQEKIYIPRLVVVLGTKCSLRCRDCSNMMPYFQPQIDNDCQTIVKSLENLIGESGAIFCLELIGGEPFLSSNLEPVLKYVICQDKVKMIEITTNGTLIPQENIIDLLKNPKVVVKISDYGETVKKDKIIVFLEKNSIKYEVLSDLKWINVGGKDKRKKGEQELRKEYGRCGSGYLCKTLYEGKIFACARAASLFALGIMQEKEYIDVLKGFNRDELKKFWIKDVSAACDYCDVAIDNPRYVEPAIQILG